MSTGCPDCGESCAVSGDVAEYLQLPEFFPFTMVRKDINSDGHFRDYSHYVRAMARFELLRTERSKYYLKHIWSFISDRDRHLLL